MNNKNNPIMEIRNITKEFPGVKALDSVNLRLYPGKCTTLMGENGAGKSTIMKIIFGIHKPTSGSIFYNGKKISYKNPKEALENKIAMVHQELNQVLSVSVMDNMFIGRYSKSGPFFLDKNDMYQKTQKIFKELDIDINPKIKIGKLTVSQRQMIEIARAISYDAKVLILDEPTSSLTDNESQKLFKIIDKLKSKGIAILFVSHKMEEIRRISDYVTIFRDGKYISNYDVKKIDDKKIIKDMVGRDLDHMFPAKAASPTKNEVVLDVQKLKSKHEKTMGEINFQLKEGEVLGIAGLVGSKRTEILEMLFGLREKTKNSQILLKGKRIFNKNPKESMKNKFAMITEERKRDGIFPIRDIVFNTTIAQLGVYCNPIGILNSKKMIQDTINTMDSLKTKAPSYKTKINNLSGGNQQKVVLSKWLSTQPNVFLMDEPTRGIDVGAKYNIYSLVANLANNRKSIIVVSSELPELLGTTHKILVMSNGKQAGILETSKTNQEEIMELASKYY